MPTDLSPELDAAIHLALEAGALALRAREKGLEVEHKTGADDPVTQADKEASELLVAGLSASFPQDGVLSEEAPDNQARLSRPRTWLVDPIDGTSEYASGSNDFCVSVGLVVDGEPMLGVIYAPATDELFAGTLGRGVTHNGAPASLRSKIPYVIATSTTEDRRELHALALEGMRPSGSTALKLARIAAGEADATFTMSPRSEWDIAAGHALLRAQGGDLLRRNGEPVRYNQPCPYLEQGFVAGSPAALVWLMSELERLHVPNCFLAVCDNVAGQRRHVRLVGAKEAAYIVTEPDGAGNVNVVDSGGDAFHLERLSRDVRRSVGNLLGKPDQSHF